MITDSGSDQLLPSAGQGYQYVIKIPQFIIISYKNFGNGCGTKSGPGPGPGAGGEEGCGRDAGVFIKARNAHPRPGSRLPRRRARGFSHISAFFRSTRAFAYPSGRAGAELLCPDSADYNPACPSRVPKGRTQDGDRNAPAGLGLSHTLAFPAQGVPMPTPKRKAGAAVSRQHGL